MSLAYKSALEQELTLSWTRRSCILRTMDGDGREVMSSVTVWSGEDGQ